MVLHFPLHVTVISISSLISPNRGLAFNWPGTMTQRCQCSPSAALSPKLCRHGNNLLSNLLRGFPTLVARGAQSQLSQAEPRLQDFLHCNIKEPTAEQSLFASAWVSAIYVFPAAKASSPHLSSDGEVPWPPAWQTGSLPAVASLCRWASSSSSVSSNWNLVPSAPSASSPSAV